MVLTATLAAELAPTVFDIMKKIVDALSTGAPQNIDEELKRLDAARLKPSKEIIDQADKDSGKTQG